MTGWTTIVSAADLAAALGRPGTGARAQATGDNL